MIGDNIRNYRKANNMSQDDLAENLGVTRQSISLWETGQTQPSLEYIITMAKLFGISTDALLMSEQTWETPASRERLVEETEEQISLPKKKKPILTLILALLVVLQAIVLVFLLSTNRSSQESKAVQTLSPVSTEPTAAAAAVPTTVPTVTPTAEPAAETTAPSMADPSQIYSYLKNFAVSNGIINGDYCYYSNPADWYGGFAEDSFSLYYWGDTDTVEFSLHRVIDDTFSINFYLRVPQTFTGEYEYISSYYYRDSGEPLYEAKGTVVAAEFTENYPLQCSKYIGATEVQNDFMEMSRLGFCELLSCLRQFTEVEELEYTFSDLGFVQF